MHKKRALLAVNATGKGTAIFAALGNDKAGRATAGQVELQVKTPIQSLTTLVTTDKNTLLAAADGSVVEFAAGPANTWSEARRWNAWSDGKDRFGAKIHAAFSKGRLWVSDSDKHRVLCFDLTSGQPSLTATFGTAGEPGDDLTKLNSPAALAANGNRAVVFDSGNQRIVRLEMESAKP